MTSTDHWLVSKAPVTEGSAKRHNVPLLRLSTFVTTAFDSMMAFDVGPQDLMSEYSSNVAPELVRATVGVSDDFATDVYTLCATLYHVLTGQHCLPHDSPKGSQDDASNRLLAGVHASLAQKPAAPSSTRRNVASELDAILLKGLEKEQADRYMDCLSLSYELRKLRLTLRRREAGEVTVDRPFVVGAGDRLARLSFPDKLFGREDSEAKLQSALREASNGGSALVRVSGVSGSGKTSLVRTMLLHGMTGRSGIWVKVKAQATADQTCSVLREFLDALLRPLLLLSQASKAARWRDEIPRLIGELGFGALQPHLDPDLCTAFGIPQKEDNGGTGNEGVSLLMYEAATAIILRLVKRMAEHIKPLVLFFDDAQFLSRSDLMLVEALAKCVPTPGLMIICADRTRPAGGDVPAYYDSPLHAHLNKRALHIEAKPLTSDDLHSMLIAVMGPSVSEAKELTPERAEELDHLQHFIEGACGLNPLACKQILLALRDCGALTFSWQPTEQWDFDESVASQQAHELQLREGVISLPKKVVANLDLLSQQVLLAAAALIAEGPFSVELLAQASGKPISQVQGTVVNLVRRKILTASIAFGQEGDPFDPKFLRFTHDSWIEATTSLHNDAALARMHLDLAIRLYQLQPPHPNLVMSSILKAVNLRMQALTLYHASSRLTLNVHRNCHRRQRTARSRGNAPLLGRLPTQRAQQPRRHVLARHCPRADGV